MLALVAAVALFAGIHLGVAGTRVRDRIIAAIGLSAYLRAFSIASALFFGAALWAYSAAPFVGLWGSTAALRSVAVVAVAIAFVLIVYGLTTPNPTVVGGDGLLGRDDAARGILRITRHPFLCGVALFTWTHLAANGDVASLVLFGGLAVVSTAGPASIDRRKARLATPGWDAYAGATSVLPFAAIAAGRNRLALGELLSWRLLVAAAVYATLLAFHARWFGASPLP